MVTYKVLYAVNGLEPGATATVDKLAGLNIPALVTGGFLELGAPSKESCPSCVERDVKGAKTKTYTAAQLAAHYGKDHPGLVAPAREEE